jgi:hypothetical protein
MPQPWERDWSGQGGGAPWERSWIVPPQEKAPTAGFSLTDIGVSGARGVLGVTKAITDVFGADNPVSQQLQDYSGQVAKLYTPERQREIAYYEQKAKEAEETGGPVEEFKAALNAIKAAPLQATAEAVGSLVPNLASLFIPVVGEVRGAVMARSAYNMFIGILEGTGAVKGSIYEGVKDELIKNKVPPEEAEKIAVQAQSYTGKNFDQIMLGSGLGLIAGKYGAEQMLSSKASKLAQKAAAIGSEIFTEAGQASQEKFASNLAALREGMDVDLSRGIIGAATREGLMGGLGAGVIGAGRPGAAPEEAPPAAMPSQFAATPEPEVETLPPELVAEPAEARVPEAPPVETLPPEVPVPPVEEERPLTYSTATQEIEELKKQRKTPEVKDRIRELQAYKMEMVADEIRRANRPISKELMLLRQQMESGALSADKIDEVMDGILSELRQGKPPKAEEQVALEKEIAGTEKGLAKELADLKRESEAKSKEASKLGSARGEQYNLGTFLKNKLTRDDVIDINPEKSFFKKYLAPKGEALELSDMVADGKLDAWLPPRMRSEAETFDEKDATEYIKEQLRQGEFRVYDAQNQQRLLGEEVSRIDERIKQLEAAKKAAQQLPQMTEEERRQEAASLAAQAGFEGAPMEVAAVPEEMEEYYPDQNEATVPPPQNEQEAKEEEQDKKQAESAQAPSALAELVMLHQFGKTVGAEPQFKRVPGGVSASLEFSPNKLLADAVVNNDPVGVITQLEASNNPFIQRIGNLARNARPFGIGLYPPELSRRAKKYSGVYIPSERNVYMRSKATAAVEHVVAHELVHHLTMDGIRNPTSTQKPVVEKIERLYKHVKSFLSSQGKGKLYALKNIDEFVAESNSNVNFQYELAKIPYQRQTAWSAFTKFVADLLGFKNPNALTETIALTDELASAPGQEAKFGKREVIGVEAEKPKGIVQKAVEKIEAAGKKPGLTPDQGFAHVDPNYLEKLKPFFAPEGKTFADKMDTYKDRTFQRLAQGIADQYRTIKDYSPLAYIKARMSKTVDGALEGLTFYGQVKLTDGALDIKQDTKGLIKTLEPIGNEVNSFLIWLALNRDASLVERGRIASISPEIVEERNKLADGKIGDKSRLEVYEDIRKELNKLNKSVLDVALQQGLIDKKSYDTFLKDVYYIPFYRMVEEGEVADIRTASGLANKYFSKALKGGEKPFGDLMENLLRNWNHILSSSMKNDAAVETIKAATEAGAAYPNLKAQFKWKDGQVYSRKSGEPIPAGEVDNIKYAEGELRPGLYSSDGKGLVKVMMNGYPAYYEVIDPLLVESIMSIGYMGPKSKFLDMARDFKNILQFGVTLSPAFKVRNLVRDSVQSAAVSGIGLNIGKNVTEGLAASKKGNPDYISALAGGAIFNFGSYMEGDQARQVKRLIKQGVNPDNILNTESKIKNGLKKMFDAYQELGNRSEAANRIALYKQLRAKGLSHLEASFQARDLLDFSMQGAWPAVRLVTQVIPFLNARVQGLYKLGRDGIIPTSRVLYNSVTGKESDLTDKQKAQQFSIVSGAVVLASLMLYMAFKDDDEFKKREQWDRDNFWWFRLPGMEAAIRIPKPFEIGAMGTFAERIAEQMFDEGAEGRVFEQSMKRMLTDTFAINPIPQMIKPLVDLYANKDSFTGAPIETAGMERLSKAERVAINTSPLAKVLSQVANVFLPEATEVSPVQTDYAIKAYLGWMGATISATSHYAVMPFSKSAYPDHNWTDTMSLGFVRTLPANQSGYVTSFYENMKIIEQAYSDMRHYAELGQAEKVQQILEEKGDKIQLAKFYDKTSKDMAKVRQAIQVIQNDETMDGAQKREEIDRLKQLIGDLAKQAEDVRKSLRQ